MSAQHDFADSGALLAHVDQLCKRTTPGPWYWLHDEMISDAVVEVPDDEVRDDHFDSAARAHVGPTLIIQTDSGVYPLRARDRQFIAESRALVDALARDLSAALSVIDTLSAELAATQPNARRYLWLKVRNALNLKAIAWGASREACNHGDCDRAVDAAIKQTGWVPT